MRSPRSPQPHLVATHTSAGDGAWLVKFRGLTCSQGPWAHSFLGAVESVEGASKAVGNSCLLLGLQCFSPRPSVPWELGGVGSTQGQAMPPGTAQGSVDFILRLREREGPFLGTTVCPLSTCSWSPAQSGFSLCFPSKKRATAGSKQKMGTLETSNQSK